MSLALHAEKNAKANYKILALEQSSGALTNISPIIMQTDF